LLLIVGAAFLGEGRPTAVAGAEGGKLPFSLALIFVLFVFGGWNEMAYVAAEVQNARRNIARALVAGTLSVTGLYLLANLAFVHALGFEGMKASGAVATDTVAQMFPSMGAALISGLICISALGAVNGLIFTGARISYAVGQDHRTFRALGRWHPTLETPATALVVQGVIAVILIVALGSFVEAVLYTAAAVYSFYAASTIAVLVLRHREPATERPFRVPGYPVTPLVFAGVCIFLIHSAVTYKPAIAAAAGVLLLLGAGIWWLTKPKPPA